MSNVVVWMLFTAYMAAAHGDKTMSAWQIVGMLTALALAACFDYKNLFQR